ncbi:MAG: NAD-dependent epimerase/dehydratase [Parcubacteria group bacterium Gr01-1014_56]|nr:MAG: NAD-dependent epimerase/dehydratase [Parcubacteria group bacterium Gr01-1014_56]
MKARKSNILVLGANGFVGRALAKKLLQDKNTVSLVSRDKKHRVAGAKMFHGDLTDPNFCKKILRGVEVVYYLASFKKNVAIHTRQPFDVVYENVLPLLTFLWATKTSAIKTLIYASSVNVKYAVSNNRETDGYVLGKYINELILKSFIAQTGIDVKIIRSSAVYGPGNDFNPEVANVIPLLIVKASYSGGKLVLRGKGKRKLQFIYIDDLVDNLIAIKNSCESFFVIGNNEAISVKDLASRIIKLVGKNVKIITGVTQEDKSTKLDIFNNVVRPKTNLDSGLRKTVAYYKTTI